MKILHLSSASSLSGAGKAALITHKEMINQGFDSKMLYLIDDVARKEVVEVYALDYKRPFFKNAYRPFITKLDNLSLFFYPKRRKEIFSPGFVGCSIRKFKLFEWADVIHIHWINHGFIDIQDIQKWQKPVIWTLRDMWAFTGGCHYSFDCMKYTKSCKNCPVLSNNGNYDLSTYVQARKRKFLASENIHWVAISSWMKRVAEESRVLKNKHISVIHSGVKDGEINFDERIRFRAEFNIEFDKKVLLIGASDIREKYKGFEFVLEALNGLDDDFLVLTFGRATFEPSEIKQRVIHFGYLNDIELSKLFLISDVLLSPSIAEAMGKVHLEAQMSGLPVVCFENTGPADIIEHLKTGYLASFGSVKDLILGIKFCLYESLDRVYIYSCAKKFGISKVVKKYMLIYEKALLDRADCAG